MALDSVRTATRTDPDNAAEVSKQREALPMPPTENDIAPSTKIGERNSKVDDRPSSSASGEAAPEAEAAADAAPVGSSSSGRTRRPRDQGGSGLQARADEFRALASDLREQAKGETGNRADNLNARADRADAAADRMEAAADRAGGGDAQPGVAAQDADAPEAPAASTAPAASSTPAARPAPAAPAAPAAAMAAPLAVMPEEDEAPAKPAKPKMAARKTPAKSTPQAATSPSAGEMVPASAMAASGHWTSAMVGGQSVMVWNPVSATGAEQSNYGRPDQSQSLSFRFSPTEGGQHRITVEGARIDSAVNEGEYNKHQGTSKGVHHLGNDVYLQVRDMDTGELVMQPQKFFLRVNDNGDTLMTGSEVDAHGRIVPATVNLNAGGNYQVEFLGRSDGFAVAGASIAPT